MAMYDYVRLCRAVYGWNGYEGLYRAVWGYVGL